MRDDYSTVFRALRAERELRDWQEEHHKGDRAVFLACVFMVGFILLTGLAGWKW